MGRVWLRARSACPPPFPVPVCSVGVRAGPESRLCPALLGSVLGVCFLRFFFWFGFSGVGCWVSLLQALWPLSPHPLSFWLGCWLFFFFLVVCVCMFRCPFSRWAAIPGLVLPVLAGWSPCASFGGPVFGAFWVGGLAASCGVGGRFGGFGLFSRHPPSPPCFLCFLGGGCLFLHLPSLGWRTHWHAFSVVFRAAVGGSVLFGRVPAPWVGWAMYTLGSAPLPAGLGPGSAGWAAAPGGCVWLLVRGLGLFVSFLLCGAGFNLLGGPPPLLPGARWPRVWPAVPVCGVLVWRLPGCAVACFGLSFRLGSVVPCCAALCRVAPRRAVAGCTVARCGAVCRGLALCRGGSVVVSLACVVVGSAGWSVAGWWLGGAVRCGCLAGSVLWGPGRAARAGGLGRRPWGCPPSGPVPWSRVLWGSQSLALVAVAVPSSPSGACEVALVAAGVVAWR